MTLQNIIDNYRSKKLDTLNIQVIEKKLSNETINFRSGPAVDAAFYFSMFKDSDLINIVFRNVYFGSSYFEKCLIKDTIFEHTSFAEAEFESCVFQNCRFISCKLEFDPTETIFQECVFLNSCFNNAIFESCHFIKPIFEFTNRLQIGSAVLIDSKFSNSNKSIEFKGEVFLFDIFDQIENLYIEEE